MFINELPDTCTFFTSNKLPGSLQYQGAIVKYLSENPTLDSEYKDSNFFEYFSCLLLSQEQDNTPHSSISRKYWQNAYK